MPFYWHLLPFKFKLVYSGSLTCPFTNEHTVLVLGGFSRGTKPIECVHVIKEDFLNCFQDKD